MKHIHIALSTYYAALLKNFTWHIKWKIIWVNNTFDKA